MSYNIDTCKIKKLENLVIPIKYLYENVNKNWIPDQPKIMNIETNEVSIKCGCEQEIKAILKDGNLYIIDLKLAGEGSGSFMSEIFENALKHSNGIFEAVFVWEGGDTINKLTVIDGELKESNVEL